MFGWLRRDPVKRLEAEYQHLLEQARDLQRGGDIRGFAAKTAEAERVLAKLERARADA